MLDEPALDAYFRKHHLSPDAREYVRLARQAPSRVVGRNATASVTVDFVSRKLNSTIQAESHTGEYDYLLELEYSESVLEFWDQPPPVSVVRTYKNGTKRSGSYTPDFVVLSEQGAEVVEIKTQQALEELVQSNPSDWERSDSDFICKPARDAFDAIGLAYRVVSTARLNSIRSANLNVLMRARRADCSITSTLRAAALEVFDKDAWATFDDVARKLGIVDYTPLYRLVDQGVLHTQLDTVRITATSNARLAATPEILQLSLLLDVKSEGLNPGDLSPAPVSVSRVLGRKQAERLLNRLRRLQSGERSRSTRRWKLQMQQTNLSADSPIHPLAPKSHLSGNRKPRLHPQVAQCARDFIGNRFGSEIRLSAWKAHLEYRLHAKEQHPVFPAVSYPTFLKLIREWDQSELAAGRGGRRAGNAAMSPTSVADRHQLPTRPFEVAAIDHYEADIFCPIVSGPHSFAARPWITVLIDQFTWSILAFWISFKSPSRRACAMVIRRCVRQHGRLPERIIFDHGPEFESVYFHYVLAHCGVNGSGRPVGHPRFGSHAERFFGLFKTQWLSRRPGNLVQHKEARAVSSSHAPAKQAQIPIVTLLEELTEFATFHDTNTIGNQEKSPQELAAEGLQRFPFSGCKVVCDDAFVIATAVDSKVYRIDPSRGIHTPAGHFWHPALRKALIKRGDVEVRDEPEDPYRIYAKVDSDCNGTYLVASF